MTTLTPGFNAITTAFAARLDAAEEAFRRNPGDAALFDAVALDLRDRRKILSQGLIAATDISNRADMADMINELNDGVTKALAQEPQEMLQEITGLLGRLRGKLDGAEEKMRRTRETLDHLNGNNSAILADCGLFIQVLQNHPADKCLETMKGDLARTQADLAAQGARMQIMVTATDNDLRRMDEVRTTLSTRMNEYAFALEGGAQVKDIVDSCSTGTRGAVSVGRPLRLRRPEARL